MPGALAAAQLRGRFWALQLGMGKARAGVPCTAAWWAASGQFRPAAFGPCCGERQHTPASFSPGLQASSGEGWGGLQGALPAEKRMP